MNSEEQNNLDDETSRVPEDSSSNEKLSSSTYQNCSTAKAPTKLTSNHNKLSSPEDEEFSSSTNNPSETDEMKRAAAKKLIERYFYLLLDGCGNPNCQNKNCASSGEVKNLTADQAAAKAIQLYSQDAQLCEAHPSKVAKTQAEQLKVHEGGDSCRKSADGVKPSVVPGETSTPVTNDKLQKTLEHPELPHTSSSNSSQSTQNYDVITTNISKSTTPSTPTASTFTIPHSIDEDKIMHLIDVCHLENSYSSLIRTLGSIFSNREAVAASFQKKPCASIDAMLEKAPSDLKNLKKEDFRTLEGDLDKDEDSCADKTVPEIPHHTTVDLISLRRAMTKLYEDNSNIFEPLDNAIQGLALSLSVDLRVLPQKNKIEEIITVFVIIFEIFNVAKIQFLEVALPNICTAAAYLPIWAQARLAWIWAEHCKNNLANLLEMLQQLITLQVISGGFYRDSYVQDNEVIVNATKVMKILYYGSILSGVLEPKLREEDSDLMTSINEDDEFFQYHNSKSNKLATPDDPLAIHLGVSVLDCRKPYITFEDFYNETLSDNIEMDKDYLNYKQMNASGKPFSFMPYSFILTPTTKTLSLYFDNRVRMYSERRISIFHTQHAGQPPNPYLKLRVRRDKLIDDALVELELVAMGNPKDLKKQLYVEFIGEQGVDEGGVSKEFFQLVVEQIFNPDYGMFIHQEISNTVWFNSTSFENDGQFTLIGIVLGLAIYNNIILAVSFPMVVYRKLMGLRGTFPDLEDANPVLYKSLKSMLEYQEPDFEDVFMQTFKVSYPDIFGNILYHELKPNGDNILVNQDNKQEFVELYSEFLLNQSVEKQFLAFRKGFRMVTDESPLQLLFRPEEIELLVCGSKNFDFNELEQATEYESGYTLESQIIIDFWSIVHGLPIESKKKLLEFTTGSDRVPVGGLSRLKLVIARNGSDCDRLPTSHTCYNILLLPEYSSKEKLEERLLKAINYSKGFGMI